MQNFGDCTQLMISQEFFFNRTNLWMILIDLWSMSLNFSQMIVIFAGVWQITYLFVMNYYQKKKRINLMNLFSSQIHVLSKIDINDVHYCFLYFFLYSSLHFLTLWLFIHILLGIYSRLHSSFSMLHSNQRNSTARISFRYANYLRQSTYSEEIHISFRFLEVIFLALNIYLPSLINSLNHELLIYITRSIHFTPSTFFRFPKIHQRILL